MISRRRFLVGTAVAATLPGLAGCESGPTPPVPPTALPTPTVPTPEPSGSLPSSDQPTASQSTSSPTPLPGDDVVRSAAAQSELDLLVAYTAALAAHPQLGSELQPFLAAHREHLTAMTGDPVPELGAPLPLQRGVRSTRRWLARLELAAAADRSEQAGAASDAQLVSVLALIAASESQHHYELDQSGAGGSR